MNPGCAPVNTDGSGMDPGLAEGEASVFISVLSLESHSKLLLWGKEIQWCLEAFSSSNLGVGVQVFPGNIKNDEIALEIEPRPPFAE